MIFINSRENKNKFLNYSSIFFFFLLNSNFNNFISYKTQFSFPVRKYQGKMYIISIYPQPGNFADKGQKFPKGNDTKGSTSKILFPPALKHATFNVSPRLRKSN